MTEPGSIYRQIIASLNSDLSAQLKKKNWLGWSRFLIFIAAIAISWAIWNTSVVVVITGLAACITVFLILLARDLDNNEKIENIRRLLAINQTELDVLHHHFTHLPDGNAFKPDQHEYANDLDIFGRASLFQYANRTTTEQGAQLFAQWLLHPSIKELILARQAAVQELATLTSWRQQLQSYGMKESIKISAQEKIRTWIEEPEHFINRSIWKLLRIVLPAISICLLILHVAGVIQAALFYPLVILMLMISLGTSKLIMPAYFGLNKIADQLDSLSNSAAWIEKQSFSSAILKDLKSKYVTQAGTSSQMIRKLKKILDMLDIRLNPLVFLPLNTFLFWDLQQGFALEKWKKHNRDNIDQWFNALAEMECLSSLGSLTTNHPDWVFPAISNDVFVLKATDLGHPLLPKDKMVPSSFATAGAAQLNLITGSNMAGKSTFLRSVGVNIILAMMGAPVCAKKLELSTMKVMSSMRVSDNLEESTSTFYAELKKLKEIIEAVNRNEKVFLLLDEILRGTNSADRHAGSEALIRQLIHHRGAGLIATHDLALAQLANEMPAHIHNYHFDVQVANEELYFDYKLKEGVCTSMNASLLMKKIGIEL